MEVVPEKEVVRSPIGEENAGTAAKRTVLKLALLAAGC